MSSKAAVRDSLQAAYQDIDDVDAWVGALSEDHVYVCGSGMTAYPVLLQPHIAALWGRCLGRAGGSALL